MLRQFAETWLYVCVADSIGCIAKRSCVFGKPYKCTNLEPIGRTDYGVAMGSPLGPLLANIFMSSIEENLEREGNRLWQNSADSRV